MHNTVTAQISPFVHLTTPDPIIPQASTPTNKRARESQEERGNQLKRLKTMHLTVERDIYALPSDLLGYISRFFDHENALAFYSTCKAFFTSRFEPVTPLKHLSLCSSTTIDPFIEYCRSLVSPSAFSLRQWEDFSQIRALHLKVESELSSQKIKTLIALLPQLRSVHIQLDTRKSNTPLYSLLQPLKKLPGFTEFNLSSAYHDNGINNLPDVLWEFKTLQKLTLKNFGCMTALPAEIGALQALQALKLIKIKLTTLPEAIWRLGKLQTLKLKNLPLTALSAGIGQLQQLRNLTLFPSLKLTDLPDEIWRLSKLQILNLRALKITTLSAKIGQLQQLRHLTLSGLRLTDLPIEIGSLQLTTLTLESLDIHMLPPMEPFVALQKLTLSRLRRLTTLNGIEKLSQLRALHLWRLDQINTLPLTIDNLTQLHTLTLVHLSKIVTLPPAIGRLPHLRVLVIRNVNITDLPIETKQLQAMQRLILYTPTLPVEIRQLQSHRSAF